MLRSILAAAVLFLPAPFASAPAVEGAAGLLTPFQDEKKEEVEDDRPEIEALLKQLVEHTSRLGKEDVLAVQVIGKLRAEFPRAGPHDRRDIAKGLYRAMKVKRRTSRDGIRMRELFFVAAKDLGEMAPESVDYLIRLVDDRNHRDDFAVRTRILAALGRTKHERAVGPLLDVLDEFQARLQAAAAEALGNFTNLDQKTRKRIFEDLLKLLTGTRSALDSDPDSSTLRDRWSRIAGPSQASMRKLSGAKVNGAVGWRRWWNKNKRRNWDEK